MFVHPDRLLHVLTPDWDHARGRYEEELRRLLLPGWHFVASMGDLRRDGGLEDRVAAADVLRPDERPVGDGPSGPEGLAGRPRPAADQVRAHHHHPDPPVGLLVNALYGAVTSQTAC